MRGDAAAAVHRVGSLAGYGLMVVALVLFAIFAVIGWRRAARRGGTTADRLQYAMAHGIPAFLIGLIAMVVAANLGWLG